VISFHQPLLIRAFASICCTIFDDSDVATDMIAMHKQVQDAIIIAKAMTNRMIEVLVCVCVDM
jgi:hypothetical protein